MKTSKAEFSFLIQQVESIQAKLVQLQESHSINYCYGTSDTLNSLSDSLTTAKKGLKTLLKNES